MFLEKVEAPSKCIKCIVKRKKVVQQNYLSHLFLRKQVIIVQTVSDRKIFALSNDIFLF